MIRGCQILFLSWLVSLSDRGLITFVLNCFVTLPWLTPLYYVLILSVVDFLTSKKVHKVRAKIWKKTQQIFKMIHYFFQHFHCETCEVFRGKSNQEFFSFKKKVILVFVIFYCNISHFLAHPYGTYKRGASEISGKCNSKNGENNGDLQTGCRREGIYSTMGQQSTYLLHSTLTKKS